MDDQKSTSRRQFVLSTGLVTASILLAERPFMALAKEEVEVGPAEDLMREHGGLNRILLIYEEGIRRLQERTDFDPSLIQKSATIVRKFIENYHEKLEEEFIFPKMRQIEKLKDLVDTLEVQHKAGKKLTATIEKLSTLSAVKTDSEREILIASLQSFIRMYRPHESREDTILFPAFHESLSEKEYDQLGEKFEDREHQLFGKKGFEGVVEEITDIEKSLGIYDLSQFTPSEKI